MNPQTPPLTNHAPQEAGSGKVMPAIVTFFKYENDLKIKNRKKISMTLYQSKKTISRPP
jgi:hypothetical protein